jgi:hypothetical protein
LNNLLFFTLLNQLVNLFLENRSSKSEEYEYI